MGVSMFYKGISERATQQWGVYLARHIRELHCRYDHRRYNRICDVLLP